MGGARYSFIFLAFLHIRRFGWLELIMDLRPYKNPESFLSQKAEKCLQWCVWVGFTVAVVSGITGGGLCHLFPVIPIP